MSTAPHRKLTPEQYLEIERKAPFKSELGEKIHATICADCWSDWLKNYSVKVINELRLDLSTDHGEAEYDKYMREFLGIE